MFLDCFDNVLVDLGIFLVGSIYLSWSSLGFILLFFLFLLVVLFLVGKLLCFIRDVNLE